MSGKRTAPPALGQLEGAREGPQLAAVGRDDSALLEVEVQVGREEVVAMVDSGASKNFVSEDAVSSHSWEIRDSAYLCSVILGDGSKKQVTKEVDLHLR